MSVCCAALQQTKMTVSVLMSDVYNPQDKESQLAAIDDLLSSTVISTELLKLFRHQHPLILSQLHLNSDLQQQQACDNPNLDRFGFLLIR